MTAPQQSFLQKVDYTRLNMQAGSAIGILATDGVVLAGKKKVISKLLETSTSVEKMYKIDDHVACAVAGIMSDANILISTARLQALRYAYAYQEPMPVEQLVQSLCDTKQGYTQFGGLRPFGVSFLFAGWDKILDFSSTCATSGNFGGWKAAAIGANDPQSILKQDYKDDVTREEAVHLLDYPNKETLKNPHHTILPEDRPISMHSS